VIFWQPFYRAVIFIVIAGRLFAPIQASNLWWREVLNSGHTVLFAFLFFVIYQQVKIRARGMRVFAVYLYAFLIAGLLGLLVEVLQAAGQRDFSLNDLVADFIGIVAGLSFLVAHTLLKAQRNKVVVMLFVISGIGFLLFGMSSVMRLSWHYVERANAFPVIMDFASNWSTSFVRLDKGRYPGVSIIEPESDWVNYHQLRLVIYSQSKRDIRLTLRVHDKAHNQERTDRFNMRLSILPGVNRFHVSLDDIQNAPIGRQLDMRNIAGVTLFTSKKEQWQQLEIKAISLE
jgi:hypothetical protein